MERHGKNLGDELAPHLPYLRRFARSLCGSQRSGDAFVAATLQAVIADRATIDPSLPIQVGLYKLFHQIWESAQAADSATIDAELVSLVSGTRPSTRSQRLVLLTTVERFTLEQAAAIMGVSSAEARLLLDSASARPEHEARRVMIIEDERLVAMDLESIILQMGHKVTGKVETHVDAIAHARAAKPDLILSDVQLADGSSGIEAVREILNRIEVPVIFITAYPEDLLTGRRPEPTYLISKPYNPAIVEATIDQLIWHTSRNQLG